MVLIVLMKGYPGSGKSHLANALAKELRSAVVDKDDARNALQPLSEAVPGSLLNDISYDIMVNCVRRLASLGMDVIVDSPLSKQSLYYRMKTIAEESNGFIILVECKSSNTDLWAERLRLRSRKATKETCHKPASMEDIEKLVYKYQGKEQWHLQEEGLEFLSVDTTTLSPDEQVNVVKKYVLNVSNVA